MTLYRIEVYFEHAGLLGAQAYTVNALDAGVALFEVGVEFGMDVLMACMREGLEVKPTDIAIRRVDVFQYHLGEKP